MARRLIDRNRARESRRQARILDQLTSQFRSRVAAEIAAAMRRMADVWQHTHAVLIPPEFPGRLEAVYQQMAYAAVSAFGSRILNQGKDAGIALEVKDFAATMHRIAMRYVQREAVRRRITNVTETTRSQVVSAVSKGYEDGLGIPEIARNISDIADDISRMRAETIARTETHGAANYGSDQAARELGLPLRREWLAAHDERTRDTHAAADGQIVGMDDPFLVGDAVLMYPGDPAGPPEEVINCRCTLGYIVDDGIDQWEPT